MRVLIVDSGCEFSPYWLQQNGPIKFDDLITLVTAPENALKAFSFRRVPEVAEWSAFDHAPANTTVFAANADGNAYIHTIRYPSAR